MTRWWSTKKNAIASENEIEIDLRKHSLVLGNDIQRELMLMDQLQVIGSKDSDHSISVVDGLKAEYLKARFKERRTRSNVIEVDLSPLAERDQRSGTFDPAACLKCISKFHRLDSAQCHDKSVHDCYMEMYQALTTYIQSHFNYCQSGAPESGFVPAVKENDFKEALQKNNLMSWLAREGNTEIRRQLHQAFSRFEGFNLQASSDELLEINYNSFLNDLFFYLPLALNVMQPSGQMEKARAGIQNENAHVIIRLPSPCARKTAEGRLLLSYALELIRSSLIQKLGVPLNSIGEALTEQPKPALKPVYIDTPAAEHCFEHIKGFYVVLAQGRAIGYAFTCHINPAFWAECRKPGSSDEKMSFLSLVANTVNTYCLSQNSVADMCTLRGLHTLYGQFPSEVCRVLVHVTTQNETKVLDLI